MLAAGPETTDMTTFRTTLLARPPTLLFALLAALLLAIDNVTAPLNVEMTASIRGLRGTVTDPGGATRETAPTVYLASGDYYPWDTVTVLALWLWCGIAVLRRKQQDEL